MSTVTLKKSNLLYLPLICICRSSVLGLCTIVALVVSVSSAAVNENPIFEKDILPIFTRYCFNCHGKSSPQMGLDLRTARSTLRGSQNGPVIVKSLLEKSLLWEKVSSREMPLALFNLKLSDDEIDTVRRWIEAGSPSDEPAEIPADVQEQFARFEAEVRPIFAEHCATCHGQEEPKAGLDLRSLESLVRGSQNGPVIVEGASEKSVLIRKVSSRSMPPPDMGRSLTDSEIRTITRWIDQGHFVDYVATTPYDQQKLAPLDGPKITQKDRQFWAFQKPIAVTLPKVQANARTRTPVDPFVLTKLESHGLAFSPDAPKLTLIRRAYFDLTGLPPTPQQVRTFLDDRRPDAYQRLIDRLLGSPRYGERWGRHWLDAVGYVDTAGKDYNFKTPTLADGIWRYRDYVIQATNEDTPWNRFLIEQIAGDELVDWREATKYTPETLELLTATGFLRNALDVTDEDISNLPYDRYEALFKLMERVSTSTLALTLSCAQCHSHKFDPIPQSDYYRFMALFTAAYNPTNWLPPKRRHLYDISQSEQQEIKREKAEANAALSDLKHRLATLRRPYKQGLMAKKSLQIPEPIRRDASLAVETAKEKRNELQKDFAQKYEKILTVTDAEADAALEDSDRKVFDDLQRQIEARQNQLGTLRVNKLQALWDVGPAPTIRLLHRGDVEYPGPKVEPGFLAVLSSPGQADAVPSPRAMGETTGLRLAFAEWLTRRDHPLTARVIVNRTWQHHFGKGIVDTPGNFGATGARPTHPELLDWLAVHFMEQGWSAKRLHKLIMTSTVYRQTSSRVQTSAASAPHSEFPDTPRVANSVDPDNRLLWRMNLRRQDAESLRDSVIAVSGQADFTMSGPPVMLQASASGLQTVAATARPRRSIYLLARRTYPLTFLGVFDYPIIDVTCTRRVPSASPLQSLTMINSEFFTQSASHLARRIEALVGSAAPVAEKIATAYRLTLARNPSDLELQAGKDHLKRLQTLYAASDVAPAETTQQPFESLVHMLLCSNEFLYLD